MTRLPRAALLIVLLLELGCNMPEGMNEDCQWPAESRVVLDLKRLADRRHLLNDVRVAEELGMRYSDSRLRRNLPIPGGPQTRDECDAKMFDAIVAHHRVTREDIQSARHQLANVRWDSAVHLPLVVLYVAAAFLLARRIRDRFAQDERIAAAIASVFVSFAVAGFMLVAAWLWGAAIEMLRVGNQHMSYRGLRFGLREYGPGVFVGCTAIFWMIVLYMYRVSPQSTHRNIGHEAGLRLR